VLEAADFAQAVEILRSGRQVEFILSDFDLGSGADGLQLAQWALEEGFKIPGAIMSGYLKSFVLPAGWQSVQKPIRLEDLRMLLAAGRNASRPENPGRGQTAARGPILVVEDNEGMRFVVVEMLRRAGYKAVDAASALQALQRLEKDSSISLVITDLGLPDKPGGQLAREIRERHPAIPVLLMSGTPSVHASAGSEAGAVLHKPFGKEDLTQLVEQALARSPG
jgi:CheY-like chemotaxis protein